jgi:4-hydroxy-tetrahydrodipicolinate reductase
MLKIALLGYGKMGKAIEEIALGRGHEIVLRISHDNAKDLNASTIAKADVAIEFSNPDNAKNNILCCLNAQVPVVSGTTGWLPDLPFVQEQCKSLDGSFLYASNFSVGVNLFFELNKKLAELMKPYPAYETCIEEIHHTQKKDAPSGTAITLAEQIISNSNTKKSWVNSPTDDQHQLSIISKREDEVPGTHSIKYSSVIDDIEIIHTAHNRKGFAFGAVLAAEYIVKNKGIFNMKDVLGL